jgi:hypothetical protein
MTFEVIQGRVEQADQSRSKGKYVMYATVRIRQDDGAERTLSKVCAAGDVAKALKPGASGRFYVTSFGGQTGIHGVRLADGASAYNHYNNIELIMLLGIAAGLSMLVIGIVSRSSVATLPVLIGAALLVGYVFARKSRLAGRRQYDEGASAAS